MSHKEMRARKAAKRAAEPRIYCPRQCGWAEIGGGRSSPELMAAIEKHLVDSHQVKGGWLG